MRAYLIRRILLMIPTLFILSVLGLPRHLVGLVAAVAAGAVHRLVTIHR